LRLLLPGGGYAYRAYKTHRNCGGFLFSFRLLFPLFFFSAAAIMTVRALQRNTLWITNFCAM
ncbi:hypothetical protein ACR8H4_26240, partial [Salmonella enterica subsp. enterica serovar Paratyphi A]